jgi:hypothetical protein
MNRNQLDITSTSAPRECEYVLINAERKMVVAAVNLGTKREPSMRWMPIFGER